MKLSRSSRFPVKWVGGLILSSFISFELDGAIGNSSAVCQVRCVGRLCFVQEREVGGRY